MKSSAKKVELAPYDDLFSTEESRQDAKLEKIQEIPLSELHPCGFAFQHDRCIFPVSVFLNGVDVFICQIDTSGKSHLSINDRYFSVISVILLYGQNRSEGIEYGALDTVFF